jgi:TadE-like protein
MPGAMVDRSQSGQAAVEMALTLPLLIFMILGVLQLSMAVHASLLAQYATFRAVRAGSLGHGDCLKMMHAAALALMPAYARPYKRGLGPAAAAARLAGEWGARRGPQQIPRYDLTRDGHDESIVWIYRDSPTVSEVARLTTPGGVGEDLRFDSVLNAQDALLGRTPTRLELRTVFWFPLKIPFANWVINRMALANFGLRPYRAVNPLLPTQTANWSGSAGRLSPDVAAEMLARSNRGHYVLPILSVAAMRQMTPVRLTHFSTQHCAPIP